MVGQLVIRGATVMNGYWEKPEQTAKKLRPGPIANMMVNPGTPEGGLKMANGENPKRAYGTTNQAPGTRMKDAALQREQLTKAQAY